jgi:dCTP deaminase
LARTFNGSGDGILPDQSILALTEAGHLKPSAPYADGQVQPASLDLRLGAVAYRVRASFLPGPQATVTERIEALRLHKIDLSGGAVHETG